MKVAFAETEWSKLGRGSIAGRIAERDPGGFLVFLGKKLQAAYFVSRELANRNASERGPLVGRNRAFARSVTRRDDNSRSARIAGRPDGKRQVFQSGESRA